MDLGVDEEIPDNTYIEDYDSFLRAVKSAMMTEKDDMERLTDEGVPMTKPQQRRYQELMNIITKLNTYLTNRSKEIPEEYVFDYYETPDGNYRQVEFRPVMIGSYARTHLFNYGDRILMMSATVLDKRIFCDSVGLDPKEVEYITVPSTFPARNRQIVKKNVGRMGYKYITKTLPFMEIAIEEILERHIGYRGIIQTHSERIATYIKEHVFDPRLTFNKDYSTPEEMLEVHRKKEGSFIVASGLREGLDLHGDLSKVQIFCKVPYPSLSDKRVSRRNEIDPDWYGYVTTLMLVQGMGRSVRSKTDKAVTYILDSGFAWFYKRNKQFIPGYIKEAIRG
jgi:Rad3-related DNA helicase